MGLCSSRPWILQHLAMHMSRCCSFSIVACALHMTPLAAQVSSTGRSLALHYRPRVTNASCTSPIQKVGISATVSSGGYITFVDYCRIMGTAYGLVRVQQVGCTTHSCPRRTQYNVRRTSYGDRHGSFTADDPSRGLSASCWEPDRHHDYLTTAAPLPSSCKQHQ